VIFWGEYENALPIERLDRVRELHQWVGVLTVVQETVVAHRGGQAFGHLRERFSHVHGSVLAHSTHLRGAGTYDAETGEERLRLQDTLATGIPEQVCREANLGYLDPATVDVGAFDADPGTLVVPNASEVLFRLR
jgi:hypothetical protein